MSTFAVRCPGCRAILSADTRDAGTVIACQSCGQSLRLPAAPAAPLAAVPIHTPPPQMPTPITERPCPFCAEAIRLEARKCRHCGETLDPSLRLAEQVQRAAAQPPAPQQTVIVQTAPTGYHFPHGMHCILTLLTCGFWSPIWLFHWLAHEAFG